MTPPAVGLQPPKSRFWPNTELHVCGAQSWTSVPFCKHLSAHFSKYLVKPRLNCFLPHYNDCEQLQRGHGVRGGAWSLGWRWGWSWDAGGAGGAAVASPTRNAMGMPWVFSGQRRILVPHALALFLQRFLEAGIPEMMLFLCCPLAGENFPALLPPATRGTEETLLGSF